MGGMNIAQGKAFQAQVKRLIPPDTRRGVITQIYSNSSDPTTQFPGMSVDLYFVDNPQTVIKKVPVAYASQAYLQSIIGSSGNIVRCVVQLFNEANARDMVVSFVY